MEQEFCKVSELEKMLITEIELDRHEQNILL